jgi:hypothetical protein
MGQNVSFRAKSAIMTVFVTPRQFLMFSLSVTYGDFIAGIGRAHETIGSSKYSDLDFCIYIVSALKLLRKKRIKSNR